MEGWVRFHRKLLDSDLWKTEPFTRGQAWVDLFSLANHKEGFIRVRGQKVSVKRGVVGWSQVALAKRWRWSRGRVRRFLDELETVQQIVQQKNNVTTLIKIINYNQYQSDDTALGTANGQQTGQQTDSKRYTNKNEKNVKNEKKKKKRTKKTKVFIPPTQNDVIQYFKDNGYQVKVAKKAFKFYNVADWKDSKGNKVLNWKQKMVSVWFKDENKIPASQNPTDGDKSISERERVQADVLKLLPEFEKISTDELKRAATYSESEAERIAAFQVLRKKSKAI